MPIGKIVGKLLGIKRGGGSAPKPNDVGRYRTEMLGAINAQAAVIPEAVRLERGMLPELQAYQREALGGQVTSNLGLYGDIYNQSRGFQQQMFTSELGMLGAGSQMATQAYRQALPGYARDVESFMGQQAMQGLMMGSELDAGDTRYAQQSSRAAAAARGLTGNQAVGMEVLGGYNLRQQRSAERQQYAQMAYQMGTNAQMQGYNQFLAPSYQQAAMFGVPGLLASAEAGVQNLGPQFLSPESQYLADIRNARMQKESAEYAARQAKKGAMYGGLLSAAGSLGGAGIIASAICWVARAVYGEDNPRWLVFRDWVVNEAPEWFRDIYIKHGERFAEYIKDKPLLKFIIRKAMDVVVERKVREAEAIANG